MPDDFSKVHPDLQQIVKKTPKITFNKTTVGLINFIMPLVPTPKVPADIQVENVFIAGQDERTKIRLRVYKPKVTGAPTPVLIWLHGGGYVIGTPEMDDSNCADFVRELGITVVSVDYRLAPWQPFPAALNDGYAALQWVNAHAQQLGVDANRLAIGGESAGGGLAAALAQLAHDRGEIQPVLQLLIYPMLDDRTVLRTEIDDSNNVTWSHKNNRFGWKSYLGKDGGAEDVPNYSAPARRADLSGLPPAWIGVGTLDIFHDEDAAYAQKLQACGVKCETMLVPGAFHGFDRFSPHLPIVQAFQKSQISALKKYLHA